MSSAPISDPFQRMPSLRRRLARHVLLPLALTWLLGTAIAVAVALYYAGKAFDRALLDDAYALSANVRGGRDALSLNLTPAELGALLFDQSETVSFAVIRADGSLLSGHPWLLGTPVAAAADGVRAVEFGDVGHLGKRLRLVHLDRRSDLGFSVLVAQTTRSRDALLQRVLAFSFGPQLALVTLLAFWLRRAIDADLRPLADLQAALGRRNANDLSAVPLQTTTRDVQLLGSAVNALMARVDASVRAQREFAGNVAHELRTPLAGIHAMAEYGLAHSEPFIWREQLTAIAASESRASHMVEQLLALAFADESRDTVRLMPVQLMDLVRSVALEAWPRADARGVDLGVAGADIPVQVMGDSALIEGAMNNLIDNALRHGKPAGHAQAVITMSVQEDAHTIALQVCDNGPGMDAVSRRILMQRWQQADRPERPDNDARRGVGLGLAIVSRYADLLGAHFELADGIPCGDGKGLCAALVWPKVAASAKPAKDVAT